MLASQVSQRTKPNITKDESYLTGGGITGVKHPTKAILSPLRSTFMESPHYTHTLRPMKLVEQADGLMQRAQALYEQHEPIMRRDDRMLAVDRMNRWA
jgi:hypothetical protein